MKNHRDIFIVLEMEAGAGVDPACLQDSGGGRYGSRGQFCRRLCSRDAARHISCRGFALCQCLRRDLHDGHRRGNRTAEQGAGIAVFGGGLIRRRGGTVLQFLAED